ncbi:MAG: RNA-binding domain-containing protein [Saprospiraceae bacterium]
MVNNLVNKKKRPYSKELYLLDYNIHPKTIKMLEYQTILKGIQKCSVLNELTAEEKEQLANLGNVVNYKKGDILFSFEDTGDAFFIVISGSLKALLRNSQKKKYKAGQLLGEVSIFSGKNRTGSIRISENASLIRFDKKDIYNANFLDVSLQLKITLILTKSIVEYFYETPVSIMELIKKGESETLEFKESIHIKNFRKIVETIVAMCNHKGGTILIGVRNDGSISGCPIDMDELMKNIESFDHNKLGTALLSMTQVFFDTLDNYKILRIECEPADRFIFWNEDGKDVLFVRGNAVNRKLETMQEVANYIQKKVKH